MSTKRLEHLKNGDKIYVPLTRSIHPLDGDTHRGNNLCFRNYNKNALFINDSDTFLTVEELKKELANNGMPKQGEMIDVRHNDGDYISGQKFVCLYEGRVIIERAGGLYRYDEWRYPPKNTELTLAEVEEKLGLEKGSLIIK